MNYSPGLDGLRAIAVLAVVFNHLGIAGFAGGYVGVDVFFVLSGFLITTIIRDRLAGDGFRLGDFYLRRIARLLPALVATVLASTLLAALLLTPWDFQGYARSAVAALVSVSNITFYLESGYWDTAAALKLLLHTWSLGVEEQFYLFWPLLLMVLRHPRGPRFARITFFALFVLGAAGMLLASRVDAAAAFYLMPFRVFQFAAGALLSLQTRDPPVAADAMPGVMPRLAGPAGIALVLLSIAGLDGERITYPGAWAFLPTAGAMLLILATTRLRPWQPAGLTRLLECAPALFLGRISYALYLVHWPLVAGYHYRWGEPREAAVIGLFVVMLVLATALHYGVELRFYRRAGETPPAGPTEGSMSIPPRRRTAGLTGLSVAALSLLLTTAWLGDGWRWRRPDLQLSPDAVEAGMQRRYRHMPEACHLHTPDSATCRAAYERRVLVLGNSLEPDGFNFLRSATGAPADLQFVLFGTTNRCRDLRLQDGRMVTSSDECQRRLDALYEARMLASLDAVLYAANRPYGCNKQALLAMLQRLRDRRETLPVITLGGYINTARPCSFYMAEYGSPAACVEAEHVTYFADDPEAQPLADAFRSLESLYIDRVELLCEERRLGTCRYATPGGAPLMYDDVHSSLEFAEYTGRIYRERHGEQWFRRIFHGQARTALTDETAAAPGPAVAAGRQSR